ncbi:hypothetical protein LTR97_004164 [Elasticomyces elasticus]|uniref:PSP proline-rich domain-containing protein n=1 Tax=Elasticomyces elasticus TaxID=574655 RepID=A0AAN7WFB9_9PEZI|nr:hypothetical protein LTR97_004164 [Elasticomyces elasticus]
MPGLIVEQPAPAAAKARKPTKNEQRRAKKKQQKKDVPTTPSAHEASPAVQEPSTQSQPQNEPEPIDDEEDADIAAFDLPPEDPLLTQFASVFKKFNEVRVTEEEAAEDPPDKPTLLENEDFIPDEDEEAGETANNLSKKAAKKASKLSIAELKALVRKPDIVDWTDPSAADPKLLVNIKSARNVVPVPAHWALKREYLSSKRGVEKAGFALPKFIAETGISEMRDATLDKQADASLKSRQRERVAPKMGKLDIDYQKLYSAFFHRQTKPSLTRYGEVYYEGKEYETNLRHLRPGELSEELKEALNMPPGAPPPWLINMQKVGPPPSYPSLRVPGLNAAPPVGAGWGFQPGGYGKPPLDESGRPLWGGDVFGLGEVETQGEAQESVDKSLWGELQVFEEEEEEEEEDEEDEDEDEDDDEEKEGGRGTETPFGTGLETPGGITSTVPTDFGGIHSMGGEEFNLRKQRRGTETEESSHPRSAGQVLQERSIRAEGFFGGEKAYTIAGTSALPPPPNVPVLGQDSGSGRKRKAGDLDVSVDPEALEREDRLSKDEVRRQYEAMERSAGAGSGWVGGAVDQEDLSQMIAEESAKRRRRDEGRQEGGGRGGGGRGRGRGR